MSSKLVPLVAGKINFVLGLHSQSMKILFPIEIFIRQFTYAGRDKSKHIHGTFNIDSRTFYHTNSCHGVLTINAISN